MTVLKRSYILKDINITSIDPHQCLQHKSSGAQLKTETNTDSKLNMILLKIPMDGAKPFGYIHACANI